MRRDMELIRALLLKLDAFEIEAGGVYSIDYNDELFQIPEYSFDEIVYHISLIHDAGFTEPYGNQGMTSLTFSGLSWSGHDFVDSVRDPEIWQQTKSTVQKVGGFTIEIIVGVAKGLIKRKLQELGIPM